MVTSANPRYFSSSYIYTNSAFAVFGIDGEYDKRHPLFPLLCATENLIQRGCPTAPSDELEEALGPIPSFDLARPHMVDVSKPPDWSQVIRGAENGNNPALVFWKSLCSALPASMQHLRALILPEVQIERICNPNEVRAVDLIGQQVDFYCPIARLVIEIDGMHHEDDAQHLLDQKRDELLNRSGVRVIRISTSRLDDSADAVSEVISALRNELAMQVGYPVQSLSQDAADLHAIQSYELAMRMQIACIELMKTGMLSPESDEWRLYITGDVVQEDLYRIAQAALQDVFTILGNLALLANLEFDAPALSFGEADAEIALDVSAFRTWDGADVGSRKAISTIIIRSAHDIFRDEFHVAAASPIVYKTLSLDPGTAENALRFFLRLLFGHDSFNPGQLGIIRHALARKPTLGILPTGSGKSACYQLACMLQPAVSFVVCPIMSLMQDQERGMREHGIAHVARLDSQMSTEERACTRRGIGEGRYQIIWISPERFQNAAFRQELLQIGRKLSFGYAVIDEVHCLSEWGHDFRVSYLLLNRTFQRFCPEACLLGLTATASRDVLADLKAELGIVSENIQSTAVLSRPELRFHIKQTTLDDRLHDLDEVLEEVAGRFSLEGHMSEVLQPHGPATICGIVFANTRAGHEASKSVGCEEIKDHLQARGIPSETYHSGRGEERSSIQRQFMNNEFPIMVATKAFGMGIDKPNIRFTVHTNLPWSIESFYQEAGRAGRSRTNNESDCYILYVPDEDEERMRKLFSPSTSIEEIHQMQPEIRGDLGTIFFLWTLSYEGLSKELRRILALLAELDSACDAQDYATIADDMVDDADLHPDQRGAQTEKAIYKLAICGFVNDWTHDWNSNTLVVELAPRDGNRIARAESSVEAYIARHAPGFSLSNPNKSYARYTRLYQDEDGGEEARIAALLAMLLMWTNDTIVFSRRAAIGNMLALCQADLTDEQLTAYIDGYFKLDTELAGRLERVVDNPTDLASWLDVFYEYSASDDLEYKRQLRPYEELVDVVPLADRFRESYPNSVGVEWVSMMGKLLAGSFSQEDVSDQFSYVFDRAGGNNGPDFDELVEETDALVELCGADARAAYENAIVSWKPDFGY